MSSTTPAPPSPSALPVPEPAVSPETEPHWAAAAEGRLVLPRCRACEAAIWYPRELCPACGSTDVEWVEASGRGFVYTSTVVHRGEGAYRDATPYVLAYVELAEGPRVLTNVVGVPPGEVHIGQEVEVVFEHSDDGGHALARFRPVRREDSDG